MALVKGTRHDTKFALAGRSGRSRCPERKFTFAVAGSSRHKPLAQAVGLL